MTSIKIQRYYPDAEPLRRLIKYFWVLDSGREIALNHTILPVANIDLIFNFLSPMTFEKGGRVFKTPGNMYFSGLRATPLLMKQQGVVLTIGVSFFPAGFYPFFKIPVTEFKNITIGLDTILNHAAAELEDSLREADGVKGKIELLERFFLAQLDQNAVISRDTGTILNQFYATRMGVRDFCFKYGVHPRKLERLFDAYVGASPKLFSRLIRFQDLLNRLMSRRRQSLTTLAHDFEFYDQTHFIKDFKSFTGSSPSRFLKEKRSVKQIMEIS